MKFILPLKKASWWLLHTPSRILCEDDLEEIVFLPPTKMKKEIPHEIHALLSRIADRIMADRKDAQEADELTRKYASDREHKSLTVVFPASTATATISHAENDDGLVVRLRTAQNLSDLLILCGNRKEMYIFANSLIGMLEQQK